MISMIMNLEYFFNLIQLFGVLLGLIGLFIVFKIQSLDTRINTYRNNIVTSIAQYEAVKARSGNDKRTERYYDELVSHYYLIYNSFLNDPLLGELSRVINELEAQTKTQIGEPKTQSVKLRLCLIGIRDKWNDLKSKKTHTISSIKYPIIISTGIILFGLVISTYYSFELVSNISDVSLISLLIFIFILFAFSSLIYISRYIYYSIFDN